MACELVSLVAADEPCTRPAAGTELNRDCSTDGPRLACRDMGPSVNCGLGAKAPRKGRCVWVAGAVLPAEDTAGVRPGPLRRPPGGAVAAAMKRLWPFFTSGSRSRPLPALLCTREALSVGPQVGRPPSPFGPSPSSCLLFEKGPGSEAPPSLPRGAGKLKGAPKPAASGALWEREAPSLKLCKLRSVARPPPRAKPLAGWLLGLNPPAAGRVPEKLFLEWAASLVSAELGSSRLGRKANRELWLRVELACNGLSAALDRPRSEMGENVDFHLLLLTGSLAGGTFLPARPPPDGRGSGHEAQAEVVGDQTTPSSEGLPPKRSLFWEDRTGPGFGGGTGQPLQEGRCVAQRTRWAQFSPASTEGTCCRCGCLQRKD